MDFILFHFVRKVFWQIFKVWRKLNTDKILSDDYRKKMTLNGPKNKILNFELQLDRI
jgi:hypothetical protein